MQFQSIMKTFDPYNSSLTEVLYTPNTEIKEVKIDKYPELQEDIYTPPLPQRRNLTTVSQEIDWNLPETYSAPEFTDTEVASNLKVSGTIESRAKSLMQKLQDKLKISKEQAAGIAGNIMVESKFNPNAKGDSGKAYGLGQWHPDRRTGVDLSSYDKQVDHLINELKTEKTWNASGGLSALRATKTAEEAASLIDKYFERSSGAHIKERKKYAKYFSSLKRGGKL